MWRYLRETPLAQNVKYFVKWLILSAVIGIVTGLIGSAFGHGVIIATKIWEGYTWTVFFMPVAGVLIVWLYQVEHQEKNRGTDLILESISSQEEIPVITAPLIFVSSILSHLVSASAGREGAALQLGGSMGNLIGKIFRLDDRDRKVAVMCGMSGCFSALFGTPLAAGVFSLEVVSVGKMYYAALVPCLFSSFIGVAISRRLGLVPEHFSIGTIPEFELYGAAMMVLLGILCALVGILLCQSMHKAIEWYRNYFPNLYVRILVGSGIYIMLTMIFSSRYYNGGGLHMIERCFEGEMVPVYGFLVKILFTAVALGAGFKGGEIVPTLCIGATFGYVVSGLLGMPYGICTAVAMVCLFVSVTNCPVSTMFMAFELFGFEAMPYFVLGIAVSFTLSGYYGLYHSQRFVYSKIRTEYIDRKSN
ncbi:chloride channel protein [Candidatus Ventrimonas sp. KK005]|nr:chloride channel protein [Lachnospiraceae bacterium]NBH18606.1 chloride channel protein [Clostridiaceae bacterium]